MKDTYIPLNPNVIHEKKLEVRAQVEGKKIKMTYANRMTVDR